MVLDLPDDEEISVASAAALSNKLLQLCNGALYDEDRNVHEVHGCKIEAFLELIEQLRGKPALVFYNFQHDRDRIKKALSKMKTESPGAEDHGRRGRLECRRGGYSSGPSGKQCIRAEPSAGRESCYLVRPDMEL